MLIVMMGTVQPAFYRQLLRTEIEAAVFRCSRVLKYSYSCGFSLKVSIFISALGNFSTFLTPLSA